MTTFKELLTEWNNGYEYGSQVKLARELKLSQSTIMRWVTGALRPSEKQIKNMAKLFKKSEEEIKAMFVVDNSVNQQANGNSGVIMGNNNSNVNNVAASHGGDIEEIRQELRETRESLGDKIKVLEAKLDLILEKLRKGK